MSSIHMPSRLRSVPSGSLSPPLRVCLLLTASVASLTLAQAKPYATLPTLTNTARIRRLSRLESNRRYPVQLHGTVTFRDDNGFFIQDSTEAIAVDAPTPLARRVTPGDVVELEGTTLALGFAPVVEGRSVRVLGS